MVIAMCCTAENTQGMEKKTCYVRDDEFRTSKDECSRFGCPFVK